MSTIDAGEVRKFGEENVFDGKRIAWVDSNATELQPLMRQIERGGCQILTFRSYEDAYTRADEEIRKCDLLVMDLDIEGQWTQERWFAEVVGLTLWNDLIRLRINIPVILLLTNPLTVETKADIENGLYSPAGVVLKPPDGTVRELTCTVGKVLTGRA